MRDRWRGYGFLPCFRRRVHVSMAMVVCAVAAAALAKLVLAYTTYGSTDVVYWELFLRGYHAYGGVALYRQTQLFDGRFNEVFNHPPFMIHALRALGALAAATHLPFPFWLRLPAILADIGAVALVRATLRHMHGAPANPGALLTLALAPASLFISGFHGNTDPVMTCFLLLTAFFLTREQDLGGEHHCWLAGAAYGMSLNIKAVPVLLVPALFFFLPNGRQRLVFFATAGAVVAVASLPFLLQDPATIAARIFGYGSQYGHWGVSRLLGLLPPEYAWANRRYERQGKYLVLVCIGGVSWAMNRHRPKPAPFLQCGFILFLFMFLTPGFGVQYLAWLVPWALGLHRWLAPLFFATSGVFLYLVYTYWSGGLPWNFGDAEVGFWHGRTVAAELLCWAVVGAIAFAYGYVLLLRRGTGRLGAIDARVESPR
jgi:4-amino-4-deoxy-L-arabinose transferase-like glycosyltransferase